MTRKQKLIFTVTSLIILVIAGCSGPATKDIPVGYVTAYITEPGEPQIGQPAPDFQFRTPEGQDSSISELYGNVVLLNFWATTCLYCAEEMPYLQQTYNQWSASGVRVLAINLGEDESTVKQFLLKHNLSLPVLLDTNEGTALQYNVIFLPVSVIIDKNGIIQSIKTGPFLSQNEISEEIRRIIS